MRPNIGITPNYSYENKTFQIHEDYLNAVWEAGGEPIILYPRNITFQNIQGLLLSGGGDVDPLLFGDEPIRESGEISPIRDNFEIPLCTEALRMKMPILGICRGMQILTLVEGGNIFQDIKTQTKSTLKHMQQAPRFYPTHTVWIRENSLLYSLVGKSTIVVNSFHHQAIAFASDALVATGLSADGLIEAVEHVTLPFVIGLQWHPEAMESLEQKAIFDGFIKAASIYGKQRR